MFKQETFGWMNHLFEFPWEIRNVELFRFSTIKSSTSFELNPKFMNQDKSEALPKRYFVSVYTVSFNWFDTVNHYKI